MKWVGLKLLVTNRCVVQELADPEPSVTARRKVLDAGTSVA
jgi:hypothetical protein